jgi:hypothetical protein
MRCIFFLLIILVFEAEAQIPRSKTGLFEYTGEVSGGDTPLMIERARKFFNQPFLVHWDSVAHVDQGGGTRITGTGYITVRAKQHSIGLPGEVPVSLQFIIEVKNGRYRYIVNRFKVENQAPPAFPLEEKPDSINSLIYDQLLQRTHKRITYVIGYLKRYMVGGQ